MKINDWDKTVNIFFKIPNVNENQATNICKNNGVKTSVWQADKPVRSDYETSFDTSWSEDSIYIRHISYQLELPQNRWMESENKAHLNFGLGLRDIWLKLPNKLHLEML